MINKVHNAKFDKFFVDVCAARWGSHLPIDPIITPISGKVVASALCVEEADVQLLAKHGLIAQTCAIEVIGQEKIYCCNYWDIIQASVCFSLIVVGMHAQQAFEFSEIFCDLMAHLSENTADEDGVNLENLTPLIIESLAPFLYDIELAVSRYGLYSIAIKVGTDLINTCSRLTLLLATSENHPSGEYSIVTDLE